MPDQVSALKAIRMFDLLVEFFDGGKNWTRHEFHNLKHTQRCLGGRHQTHPPLL
jgi:hypothetical protein